MKISELSKISELNKIIELYDAISYLRTDHPTAYRVSEVINSTTWSWGTPRSDVYYMYLYGHTKW